jgi:hypothetical protein
MRGIVLTAGVLVAASIVVATHAPSPAHLNKSGSVVSAQSIESVKQPPSNASEQVTKPIEPENKAVEQSKPQESQPIQAKEVVQVTPALTPKEQAKATLEDLGQGDAWYAVEYIGFKESSWNPHAINYLGACGLFQALPCTKLPCELSDVPCQVRWATNYATQRYGSWHYAYTFWKTNGWW